MKAIQILTLFLITIYSSGCQGPDERDEKIPIKPDFGVSSKSPEIIDLRLMEASGIEASVKNPGYLWTHNDSGDTARIFLIDTLGKIKTTVILQGLRNIDWEELLLIDQGDSSEIILGEIGDNFGRRNDIMLYRFDEPQINGSDTLIVIENVKIERMGLSYKEGPRDSETLFYDYNTEKIVQITKREDNVMVYSYNFKGDTSLEIESLGTITARNFTAGDANKKGEILIKNYDNIFYFGPSERGAAERILEGLKTRLKYEIEPQGEAICWFGEDSFYTISEKNENASQVLYEYSR